MLFIALLPVFDLLPPDIPPPNFWSLVNFKLVYHIPTPVILTSWEVIDHIPASFHVPSGMYTTPPTAVAAATARLKAATLSLLPGLAP